MRARQTMLAAGVVVALILGAVALVSQFVGGGPDPSPPEREAPLLDHQASADDLLATQDSFGISYLRPTQRRGTIWESQWTGSRRFDGVDPVDPWFDADHGSATYRVKDGQLFITGEVPRMYIHDPLMQRQWRDVEVTVYFKRVKDSGISYAGMTAVARSNHLETESGTRECDTRGIGARIRYDGHTDFEKETAFPLNQATRNLVLWPNGMPRNQWIGFKYLVHDQVDGVHLELWTDLTDGQDGGDWQLSNQLVDDGHILGQVPCAPGINPRMKLTNAPDRKGSETGLPNLTVYFRSDGVHKDGLVYKWASVREIDASAPPRS